MRRRFLIPGLLLALTACDRDVAPTPASPSPPPAPVVQPPPPPPAPVQTPRPEPTPGSEAPPRPPAGNGRLPLARILAITQADTPGEVIDVELDNDDDDDDGPTYEITVLTPEGRSIEIKLDARTGAILEREED